MARIDISKMIVGGGHKKNLPVFYGQELRSRFEMEQFQRYAQEARDKISESDNLEFYMACYPSEIAEAKHHMRQVLSIDRGKLPF